ncbi:aspartate--tRNA ligase [Acholeplasma sp. OttesenSCG-928-E16]|nr:aspartate--tRNA ligase [Acholeplasma sp. OttesenSCG-928-E16]
MKYTNNNNELTIKDVNKIVYLKGWVAKKRNLGGLIFIDLRDRFGITQIIVKPENENYELASQVRVEYVIEVKGVVVERESKNPNIKTGEIEIIASSLVILSTSETPPIIVSDDTDASEEVRLKYRYLDLRRPIMQDYLIKRHKIAIAARNFLSKEGFYELETPILGKSTPEGARDFLVPARLYKGEFYALPQSPQLYKQLFMIAGFEKYFQIARCFRDEDLRADRQLEFTQIDVEASFVDQKDIIKLTEKLFKYIFKQVLDLNIKTPFLKMTYKEAMNKYGSDKPDNRFELFLNDYKAIFSEYNIPIFKSKRYVKGIIAKTNLSRKEIDKYTITVKQNHGESLAFLKVVDGEISGSIAKFVDKDIIGKIGLKENETLLLVPGDYEDVSQSLGALRLQIAEDYKLYDENEYSFLWVTDFPLLEYDKEDKRFYARHHPFTAPKDVDMLKNNPKKCLAKAYDIVINGYEVGGGSIRIHNEEVQKLMFETLSLTKVDIEERFGFFVEALKYGTPPHGGIAFGLDRLVMLITKTRNIKDVIAFPKTQSARDLMMQAPSTVDEKQLVELNISIKE